MTCNCLLQVRETAKNIDVAVRELPDANTVSTFTVGSALAGWIMAEEEISGSPSTESCITPSF